MTSVVNMKDVAHLKERGKPWPEPYVYIGRPSKWGNPYKMDGGGDPYKPKRGYRTFSGYTREAAVECYRFWVLSGNPAFELDDIRRELQSNILVCWCAPLPCHGDVLAELADMEV